MQLPHHRCNSHANQYLHTTLSLSLSLSQSQGQLTGCCPDAEAGNSCRCKLSNKISNTMKYRLFSLYTIERFTQSLGQQLTYGCVMRQHAGNAVAIVARTNGCRRSVQIGLALTSSAVVLHICLIDSRSVSKSDTLGSTHDAHRTS